MMNDVYMRINRFRQWIKKDNVITCDQPLNSNIYLYHDVCLKKEKSKIKRSLKRNIK